MSATLIQPFASKSDTPRVQLSRLAFEVLGTAAFATEKIPFSGRSDAAFAEKIGRLFLHRTAYLDKHHRLPAALHLYELGCGQGLLGYHLLTYLEKTAPTVYSRTVLHLTDFSPAMIAELKSHSLWRRFGHHLEIAALDAVSPHFPHPPFFIYHTNLFDSLPYRQVFWRDGELCEIRHQTLLKKQAYVIDGSQIPPRLLTSTAIKRLLTTPSLLKKHLHLASQLAAALEEQPGNITLSESRDIPPNELKTLEALCRQLQPPIPFHYSHAAYMCLKRCIKALVPGGLICVSDFGTTALKDPSFVLNFGLVQPASVCFALLQSVARTRGTTVLLTHHASGEPQEMVVDTLPADSQLPDLFKRLFSRQPDFTPVTTFLTNIKTLPPSDIDALYRQLPQSAQTDFQLLNELALFLVRHHAPAQTLSYLSILKQHYHHTAGLYCYLIAGHAYQALGKNNQAETCLTRAATFHHPLASAYLANFYWETKQLDKYIESLRQYLKYTRKSDHLQTLLTLARAYHLVKDEDQAQKVLHHVIHLGNQLPHLFPTEQKAVTKARELVQ